MKVSVIHAAFSDKKAPRLVAFVDVPEGTPETEALEIAFRKTNNIEGSWSRGEEIVFEGKTYDNPDFCESVTVMAELPVNRDGEVMGLRSTSMGDQMLIGTKKYEVAMFGFEEIV